MFYGEKPISIDAKGRVAVPTCFRDGIAEVCANKLVLTYSVHARGCLWLYPHPIWEELRDQVNGLNEFVRQHRMLKLKVVNSALEVEPDANGRIVLPPKMRQVANVEKHAIFMGAGKRFEIWNEEALAKERGDYTDINAEDVSEDLLRLEL